MDAETGNKSLRRVRACLKVRRREGKKNNKKDDCRCGQLALKERIVDRHDHQRRVRH